MLKLSRVILITIISLIPFITRAQTINSPTCNQTDVLASLNNVTLDGTTVVIPAGSCTWTTPINYSASHSLTIVGQSTIATNDVNGNPATFNDTTTIIDAVNHASIDYLLTISLTSGKTFRISGLTITGNGNGTISNQGVMVLSGTSQSARVDHMHFINNNQAALLVDGQIYGVQDHCLDNQAQLGVRELANNWRDQSGGGGANGDGSWSDTTTLGSNRFWYTENSTFIGGIAWNDCLSGGRFVFRYNTLIGGNATGGLQTHPTGHTQQNDRGCRVWEIYNNFFSGTGGAQTLFNGMFQSAGVGMFWGNNVPATYSHVMTLHSMRRNNTTYPQGTQPINWGYCGTSFNGTGSSWDGNTNTANGYPCLDMPGRGIGDLLSGQGAAKVNTVTGTQSWPRQAIEPTYEWMTSGWSGLTTFYILAQDGGYSQNQDYYEWCDPLSKSGCTSFNGTVGVGSGNLINRPATCTPNPVTFPAGNQPGVAYWAKDQGSWNQSGGANGLLYVCTAPNVWTLYYTPYTYPHPLVGGAGPTPPPPPPLGISGAGVALGSGVIKNP